MRSIFAFISSMALVALVCVGFGHAQAAGLTGATSGVTSDSITTGTMGNSGSGSGSASSGQSASVSGSGSVTSGSGSASGSVSGTAHGSESEGSASDEMDTNGSNPASSGTDLSLDLMSDDVASASLDEQSAMMSASSVVSPQDLNRYATATMKRDANISSINASGKQVSLVYRVPARFLGVIPTSLSARTVVGSDGSVAIHYPWYRFLFSVPNAVHADSLKADLQGTLLASVNGRFDPLSLAQIIDQIHAAFADAYSTGSASAGSTSTSGTGTVDDSMASTSTTGADASASGSAGR